MTSTLAAAAFGAITIIGVIGAGLALRPTIPAQRRSRRTPRVVRAWAAMSPHTKATLVASFTAGFVIAVVTGWVAAVVIIPVAAWGLPYLLSAPPAKQQIERVEAMEEWTRTLSGVLGAGVGIEQALTATLRSTPDSIKAEVTALVARLRGRWDTEAALRAFADDLNDAVGDLIAANLILAARRRNRSLAAVLHGVAESVAEEVAARRRLEAGRAKPRGSVRVVTGISLTVLVVLALTGEHVAPYGTPVGQVILVFYLSLYAAALWWMRRMAHGEPLPRFLGPHARAGAT